MFYVRYTFVDAVTKIPCTQAPCKNGPTHPDGITPTFVLEETFGPTPQFYGITEDKSAILDWMTEVTEGEFFQIFKNELELRARKKRKQVEQGGITVGETFVRTDIDSQNRVASLVTSLQTMPELQEIDFESVPGTWVTLTREAGYAVGAAVSTHVQSTFSWNRQIHEKIQAIATLDDALPVVIEIAEYSAK